MTELSPMANGLPSWARSVFQSGLEPYSGSIWVAPDFQWSLRDQSRAAVAAEPRHWDEAPGELEVSAHFKHLIAAVLEATGAIVADDALILDLGSGSGAKSVFPCLQLFPDARIVAADAGMQLARLSGNLRHADPLGRVICLLMDPERITAPPASFDLVIGVGFLHRRLDPDRVIAGAARVLKPGGHALFLEPFDGHGLLRLAYEQICRESDLRGEPLHPAVRRALEAMAADIGSRTLPDPTRPGFEKLEQRWLFSREAIEGAARNLGFGDVRFVTHNDHWTLYRDIAFVQLRLASGLKEPELPAWALTILDGFDQALPPPVKRLLMVEGSIVLTR